MVSGSIFFRSPVTLTTWWGFPLVSWIFEIEPAVAPSPVLCPGLEISLDHVVTILRGATRATNQNPNNSFSSSRNTCIYSSRLPACRTMVRANSVDRHSKRSITKFSYARRESVMCRLRGLQRVP